MIALIVACVVHAGVEQEQREDENSTSPIDPIASTEAEEVLLTSLYEDDL
jgi:hypothetical protein